MPRQPSMQKARTAVVPGIAAAADTAVVDALLLVAAFVFDMLLTLLACVCAHARRFLAEQHARCCCRLPYFCPIDVGGALPRCLADATFALIVLFLLGTAVPWSTVLFLRACMCVRVTLLI